MKKYQTHHRAGECNHWNEKYNRRVQQQTSLMEEGISEIEDRIVEFIHSEEQKEKEILNLSLNTDGVEKFHYKPRLQATLPVL